MRVCSVATAAAALPFLRGSVSRLPLSVTAIPRAVALVVARHVKRARLQAENTPSLLAFASANRRRARSPAARAANRRSCHSRRGRVETCIAPRAFSPAASRTNDRPSTQPSRSKRGHGSLDSNISTAGLDGPARLPLAGGGTPAYVGRKRRFSQSAARSGRANARWSRRAACRGCPGGACLGRI